MGNFRKLTENQIEKYASNIKDETKRDAYVKTINSDTLKIDKTVDTSRNDAFERIYKTAMTLAKRRYSFGRNAEIGMSLVEIASMYTKEYVFYKSSILGNFEQSEGKNIFERVENAEKKSYQDRTKEFFKKYGDEVVYTTDDKTLNDYLREYEEGKISKEELNFIIYDFKDSNEEYLSTDYKTKYFESAESIISDNFSD